MPVASDLIGKKFGRLTVIRKVKKTKNYVHWECSCECGGTKTTITASLNKGVVKSCGCIHKEITSKHGMYKHPLYQTWLNMTQRCNNPKNPIYKYYGARGVKVCDHWLESFENFYNDMGEKPEGASLDRIDDALVYSKETCKWSDKSEQVFNRRPKKNKSGYTGVKVTPAGNFSSGISKNGKFHYLGTYDTLEEAIEARKAGEAKYYPDIRRPNYRR